MGMNDLYQKQCKEEKEQLEKSLVDIITMTAPGLVIYERAHMRGGFATDLLVGFTTRIQETCAEKGIECEAVHSATLKKGVTGSGRADKGAIMRCMSEEFGRRITDDNEADALGLLWLAMQEDKS